MSTSKLAFVLLLSGLGLAACGGSGAATPTPAPSNDAGEASDGAADATPNADAGADAAPSQCSSDHWCKVEGANVDLRAVWGSSPTNVWAVGSGGTIFHYDGARWTRDPQSGSFGSTPLHAVWGSSEKDVWAVGLAGTILRYDGTSWKTATTSTIQDLFIVGQQAEGGLDAVTGSGPNDVWAVGGTNDRAVSLHWNGANWSEHSVPTDVVSMRGAWTASSTHTVVAGIGVGWWNGNEWSALSDQDELLGTRFHGVWGHDAEHLWLVGMSGIASFDGSKLTEVLGQPENGQLSLRAVSGAGANAVWAVGRVTPGAASGLIYRWNGQTWSREDSGVDQTLHSVWAASATNVWAVGERGTLLHYKP